jgi:hypothetical protein
MRSSAITFVRPPALGMMIFYFFIPFQIVAGAPDWLGRLRPFVPSASVMFIAFGFFELWRDGRSKSRATTRARLMLSLSALVVLCMMLFPLKPTARSRSKAATGEFLGKSSGGLT